MISISMEFRICLEIISIPSEMVQAFLFYIIMHICSTCIADPMILCLHFDISNSLCEVVLYSETKMILSHSCAIYGFIFFPTSAICTVYRFAIPFFTPHLHQPKQFHSRICKWEWVKKNDNKSKTLNDEISA